MHLKAGFLSLQSSSKSSSELTRSFATYLSPLVVQLATRSRRDPSFQPRSFRSLSIISILRSAGQIMPLCWMINRKRLLGTGSGSYCGGVCARARMG